MLFSVDLGLWLLSASMDLSDVDFTDKKSPKLAKVIYALDGEGGGPGSDPSWAPIGIACRLPYMCVKANAEILTTSSVKYWPWVSWHCSSPCLSSQ